MDGTETGQQDGGGEPEGKAVCSQAGNDGKGQIYYHFKGFEALKNKRKRSNRKFFIFFF